MTSIGDYTSRARGETKCSFEETLFCFDYRTVRTCIAGLRGETLTTDLGLLLYVRDLCGCYTVIPCFAPLGAAGL